MFEIDICNSQQILPIADNELRQALVTGLQIEGVQSAVLSVSIVDNAAIHVLNREHLQHDYPTDVISFQLDFYVQDPENHADCGNDFDSDDVAEVDPVRTPTRDRPDHSIPEESRRAVGASIEGEIIASAEMAAEMAKDGGWTPLAELKLYLIHGMLHICGYDDLSAEEQGLMRSRERIIMAELGLKAIYTEDGGVLPEKLSSNSQVEDPDPQPDPGGAGRSGR